MLSKNNDFYQLTDEALAVSAQRGNISAETELLKRFNAPVRFTATSYKKEHSSFCDFALLDSDDLIQEGSLGLLSAIYTFDPEKNVLFRTYASKCISNAIASAVKAGASKKHTPPGAVISLDTVELPSSASPEEELLSEERLNEIKKFLSEDLSDKEFSVIRSFLSGRSYKDISLKLNISEKSVDNTMQRIRAKLRKFLESNRS